jgi:hypothetical protein
MAQYVFNTLLDLTAQPGAAQATATLLGYSEPGDGGGSDFYWDDASTAASDGVMVVQVSGVTQGRWVRITSDNTLNLRWFGAKADKSEASGNYVAGSTDNLPIMQKALAYVRANPQQNTIFLPAADNAGYSYFFADTIQVDVSLNIEGEGLIPSSFTSQLTFLGTAGIYFQANQGYTYGSLKRLRLANIPAALYQADGKKHGVEAHCRMLLEDVSVQYFQGSGFYLQGNVLDTPVSSNSSIWEMHRCSARFNAEHGIHVVGGDINVGFISTFDASINKYWGILDESLLSCAWTNVHTNNNGIYLGSTCRVHIGDVVRVNVQGTVQYFGCQQNNTNQAPIPGQSTEYWHYLGNLVESDWYTTFRDWSPTETYEQLFYYVARRDNVNQKPVPGYSNAFWTLVGTGDAFAANVFFRWNATDTFRSGGAIATTRDTNNSVFTEPYSEQNQGHILLRGRGMAIGGECGTPVVEGTYLLGGGGLIVPNGSVSAGLGFTSSDNSFSLEFSNYGRDLVRTTRTVEFSTAGNFQLKKLDEGVPTFVHIPGPAGKTFFGWNTDRTGRRYQFNDGDVSVLNGNIYVVGADNGWHALVPFLPVAENQYGTHPAFTDPNAAIAWLLSK